MNKAPQELLKEYVQSHHFTSTAEIMAAMKVMFQDVITSEKNYRKADGMVLKYLKVHHRKKVSAWLDQHRDQLELFFLPPYAPECSPDEYLNHALKLSVHSGTLPHTRDDIKHNTESFMRLLQRNKPDVSAFFRHKLLPYICIQE